LFNSLPPIADGGIDHSTYLDGNSLTSITAKGRIIEDESAVTFLWEAYDFPIGSNVTFSDPNSDITQISFDTAGSYLLKFSATNMYGTSSDYVRVHVFAPHPVKSPAIPHPNPNPAGTHFSSFRSTISGTPYTQSFVDSFLYASTPNLKLDGFASERFQAPPPAYQHPRLFFNHSDEPDCAILKQVNLL